MSSLWRERFRTWSKPPSDTEEAKAKNAADQVRAALKQSPGLSGCGFDVYATGSYSNNTNVKLESDIDIAAVLTDAFSYELPAFADERLTAYIRGLGNAQYTGLRFREDVSRALETHFGTTFVRNGKKAVEIRETTRRLNADVAAFMLHRRYTGQPAADGSWAHESGVELQPRDAGGGRIINWHRQHYDRGVARNLATRRRFKRVVRVLKNLRDHMAESGTPEARAVAGRTPSFLIESLVYNAPDSCFNVVESEYDEDVKATVANLWARTKDDSVAAALMEVNEMKGLFSAEQAWSRADAHEFLLRAWQHAEFKST